MQQPRALSESRLRAVLTYDPATGVFRWRCSAGKAVAGEIAGSVNKRGYRVIGIDGARHQGHRLAWFYVHGVWPGNTIDHRDLEHDHNWIDNLRPATRGEQNQNIRPNSRNKSGHIGVSWSKRLKRWRADICLNRKSRTLGHFVDKADAIAAHAAAKATLHTFNPVAP